MKLKSRIGLNLLYMIMLLGLLTSPVIAQTATQRPESWAKSVTLEHAENFYQVTEELYRAAQPTAAAMRTYEDYGIRTVINLRSFHSDEDEIAGTNLVLVELPTHAWKDFSDDYVIEVLQAIRKAQKPVLLHCQHGADRTGMIIAMYRIVEQGWSREAALDEMRNGDYGFHSIWQNIPDYIKSADIEKIRAALLQNQ